MPRPAPAPQRAAYAARLLAVLASAVASLLLAWRRWRRVCSADAGDGGAATAAASAAASTAAAPPPDAREKALTEELFAKLLEHSKDMFVFGNGNEVEFESASIPRTLGHSLLGPVLMGNVHPEDRAALGEVVARCTAESCATGAPVSACLVMRFLAKDGTSPLWVENKVTFVGLRWYCCWRDVSTAKKAERSLHDWLATTSHDARTPLSSIQVSCQLLRERALSAEAAELLTAIGASARVLLTIVQNVMLLKRLDAGECDAAATPVCLRDLVADVCATARVGLACQSGAAIVWDDAAPLPDIVLCAKEHLSHMLLSLTVYCTQAAGGEQVLVRVLCEPTPADAADAAAAAGADEDADEDAPRKHRLVLEVSALGRVLTAEQLSAVFDPYTAAAHDAQHEAGGGSGRLGLHVSRRLAEALGGSLSVRSRQSCGTRFTVAIPVLACAAGGSPLQLRSPPLSPSSGSQRSSYDGLRGAADDVVAVTEEQLVSSSDAEDTGLLPFLAPNAELCEGFQALMQRGMLSEMTDLLLNNSPDGYTVGEGASYIYVSPGFLKLLRFGCKEEGVGAEAISFVHPDDREHINADWAECKQLSAARGNEPVYRTFTYRALRTDGTYLWVEAAACITPTHWYNIVRDITDQRRLEASLKGFLTSTMADMRQPLTGIQAASELLAQRVSVREDEDASFLVAAISSASHMLMGIVANVLSLRSLEAGQCTMTRAPFSIRQMVDNVLSVCRTSLVQGASTRNVWLDEASPLPALVSGDADRLSQVLLNLLTNASKFADGTDVTISVHCEPAADAACALTLVVADGGRGMSAEESMHVFEPYYRSPTHKGGGTGLGLYICKRFVEAHGGTVALETAPGHGARFTVVVPLQLLAGPPATPEALPPAPAAAAARAPSSANGVAAAAPLAVITKPPPPSPERKLEPQLSPPRSPPKADRAPRDGARKLHCLLVEDHQLNARLCKRLLESQAGMTVSVADDGDVALRMLIDSYEDADASPYDLCLMDIQMPRLDGLQATKRFRAFERQHRPEHHLPVVALSANVFDEAINECTDAGMDGFVPKPLRLDMLRAALASRLTF